MSDALQRYRSQLTELDAQRESFRSADARWNMLRVVLFLVMLFCFGFGSFTPGLDTLIYVGWLALAAFLVIVTIHQRLRDQLESLRDERSVLRRLMARVERRWDGLPQWRPDDAFMTECTQGATNPDALSDDLDVFGTASLFQLVSMASTGPGQRTLATWLLSGASAPQATERHLAAEALAGQREQRGQIYKLARHAAGGTADPDHFLAWIKRPSWLLRHPILRFWSIVSPILAVGAIIALLVVESTDINQPLLIALGLVIGINALLSTFLMGEVHDIFAAAISGRGDVAGYQQLFAMASQLPTGPRLLDRIRAILATDRDNAAKAMDDLRRIALATEIKRIALLFPIYLILQMCGLWEIHVLRWLERWQDQHRESAQRWFDSLGELEAVASIAAISDENPNWASPVWSGATDECVVRSVALGHPLIRDDVRVCNDVVIGPPGTLLLVTGSNMSGKSTMLRSVGLNVLLAGAGSRVCARDFQLPSLELATSIRVRDNLGEGVSFYMAELKSLAKVVKHAEQIARERMHAPEGSPRLLFLLDEILQGTNSRERQIAVAHVLKHLIRCEAIGAITTHDLELADDPQLKALAHTVHFRETIEHLPDGSDTMTFDYRMHDGISPTTNALRLLEIVGLGKASV